MNVLVAHHDRWTRLVLADVLARAGFRVAEASNGTAALRMAAQTRPQVVVLGAHLSELAAGEVRSALKADPETRTIGVFVVAERALSASCGAVAVCRTACRGARRLLRPRRVVRRRDAHSALRRRVAGQMTTLRSALAVGQLGATT